jgi:hypothetical protein
METKEKKETANNAVTTNLEGKTLAPDQATSINNIDHDPGYNADTYFFPVS